MSRRPRRTKVYDCNYNIGERYYKPTLDSLDRKYSGRPDTSSVFDESPATRASKLFEDMDLNKPNGMNRSSFIQDEEDDFGEEMNATLKRIKAARAQRSAEIEDELENFSNRKNDMKKRINMSEKLLDSVGLNEKSQSLLEDEIFTKKRTIKANDDEDDTFAKWTQVKPGTKALRDAEDAMDGLAAVARARKSRARLADIDAEMEELAERGAAREKRLAGLKTLMADTEDQAQVRVSKRVSVKATTEKKQVTF
uniref:Uncharacterized protein n=2 Tax=Clastoptera arizonana TaxID=38151 RepID=A0A1B6CCA2_9HEMI